MPTYQGQVSEEGVIALVEYIKNLHSDYRIEQTLNTTDLLPESEGSTKKAATGGPANATQSKSVPQKTAPQGVVNQ
jgi:cytochrome c oxidase subunit 2